MTTMTAEELLDGIREELMVIKSHAGKVAMHLERIADSLPIPFVPVSTLEQRRDENFRKALEFVREILDSNGSVDSGRRKLFDIEALLSYELGEPIWEGREPEKGAPS